MNTTDSELPDHALLERFAREGFVGPLRVLSVDECRQLAQSYRSGRLPLPIDWTKGYAPSSRILFEIATRREVLDRVRALIGDDVMLWGTQLVVRPPGAIHTYHTDLETSDPSRKSVSVWIGIRNTSIASSLRVIPGSHRFGVALKDAGHRSGLNGHSLTQKEVEEIALSFDRDARIIALDMSDGEALLFDGRLWHGSHNERRNGVRFAVLLQYAAPETPIRIPNLKNDGFPRQFFTQPRPPCIMVDGSSRSDANRLEPGPVDETAELPVISSWIRRIGLPLTPGSSTGFKAFPQARGATAILTRLTCHASALAPGKSPHPPHAHEDEEVLITLSGQLDILGQDKQPVHRTEPGAIVYYPAHFKHTVSNPGPGVANYLMFKWTGDRQGGPPDDTESSLYTFDLKSERPANVRRDRIIDRETSHLNRLRCHKTVMNPGEGYAPHVDAYDVAIVTLAGEVETLGERIGPGCVAFYTAGEPHGLTSTGEEPASYLVFEFRGGDYALPERQPRSIRSLAKWARRRVGAMLVDYPRLRRLLGR